MVNGSVLNNNMKKIMLHRSYTPTASLSSTQYLNPTQYKVGVDNGTPSVASTDLDNIVPIDDGTANDDGSNQLTGSSGGDNSTDNTSTYKEGAGQSDATAQNLIANNTNATKIWTISDLSVSGTNITASNYASIWLYIKDATALAKFKSSGTALELKLGSDSSNYYSITKEASDLSTGWNWITDLSTIVSAWTETGTVAGAVDTFIITITTNNSTDTFVAGDVVYDLLRTWASTDTIRDFDAGYPSINYDSLQATTRCTLGTTDANGFDINGLGFFNEDSSVLMTAEDTFADESKSSTDEIVFQAIDRLI